MNEIFVTSGTINYGHKDLNPVNYVEFYKKGDFTSKLIILLLNN